jgi:hypothetical protein
LQAGEGPVDVVGLDLLGQQPGADCPRRGAAPVQDPRALGGVASVDTLASSSRRRWPLELA